MRTKRTFLTGFILAILFVAPAAQADEMAVRLQMVLDREGLKLREGFNSHINHTCLSGKFQKAILHPS
jgi:hypothetical protein